jgi:hypothetical protein
MGLLGEDHVVGLLSFLGGDRRGRLEPELGAKLNYTLDSSAATPPCKEGT